MKLFGFDVGSLLSLGGGLVGGWVGYAVAFAAGVAITWQVAAWEADQDALSRERVHSEGLRLINAANDAATDAAAADARRALEAAEAAAAAERERADALARQVDAIRAIPDAENCALGLETIKILKGLM